MRHISPIGWYPIFCRYCVRIFRATSVRIISVEQIFKMLFILVTSLVHYCVRTVDCMLLVAIRWTMLAIASAIRIIAMASSHFAVYWTIFILSFDMITHVYLNNHLFSQCS